MDHISALAGFNEDEKKKTSLCKMFKKKHLPLTFSNQIPRPAPADLEESRSISPQTEYVCESTARVHKKVLMWIVLLLKLFMKTISTDQIGKKRKPRDKTVK